MAKFSDALARHFSSRIRSRGLDYFRSDSVRIESAGEKSIVATVDGGDVYVVTLSIEKQSRTWRVSGACTCPYAQDDYSACKHLWALILECDSLPSLRSPPASVSFRLSDWDEDDEDVEYVEDDEDDFLDDPIPYPIKTPAAPPAPPKWASLLDELARRSGLQVRATSADRVVAAPYYVLEAHESDPGGRLIVSLAQVKTRRGEQLRTWKRLTLGSEDFARLPDELDRRICLMMVAAATALRTSYYGGYASYSDSDRKFGGGEIAVEARPVLLPLLFQSGRFLVRRWQGSSAPTPLAWDDGPLWELSLALRPAAGSSTTLELELRRGDQRRAIDDKVVVFLGPPTYVLIDDKLSALESYGCADWINEFRSRPPLAIAEKQRDEFVSRLARSPKIPPIEWPSNWKMQELCDVAPRPELTLHTEGGRGNTNVEAGLCFHYGEQSVDWSRPGVVLLAPEKRCQVVRQIAAEEALVQRLPELGFQHVAYQSTWKIPGKQVPFAVAALLQEGWQVRGNKQLFRRPGAFKIDVASGIDWFDMGGGLEFDGLTATLPELLAALRRGERFVRLGDGSLGMLPEEWLKRHGALLQLGEAQDGKVRFQNTQLGLLDALLAELPEVNVDESLAAARQKLSSFIGIAPREAGGAFAGSLRGYQKAGLGWLHFLRDFRWGGCLADDMGLGKTVQVLALLLDAHAAKKPGKRGADAPPPSLAVMPRSIVFNWMREAASFAPGLRVLDYSGGDRKLKVAELDQADLVLMTYGTLRRDIAELRKREFNYVILDEAQAIKNPESQNAKSARLLCGRCRLAMTGTPVENSLNDLWSIFEFLNPGMLGGARAFRAAFSNGDPSGDGASHRVLQRLLRPFILRRRKEQVASDLPPRTEQTIECTMPAAQARHYAQLRDHYRAALLGRIDRDGLNKSKVFVLEALLRLRQAACHPGLIDERFGEMETAKLDALLPMLAETTAEGHKTLVFSQFTEFLSIVRTRLDAQGLTYEYLDGQTRDRQARVDRFQNDAACPLFLISLKAGGVGLNLTAADYVVILDPWWNPAVEAQAIDRTHRIGQTRSVIAYRLIARDTVEARILELQQRKRDLADAIITQANSLLTDLTRDDLNLLLS